MANDSREKELVAKIAALEVQRAELDIQKGAVTKIAIAAVAKSTALEFATPENAGLVEEIMRAAGRSSKSSDGIAFDNGFGLQSADAFLANLRLTSPGLFKSEASGGTGNRRAPKPSTNGIPNPYRRNPRLWNLTTQFQHEKSKPALAAQLKAEAEAEEGVL